MENYVRPQIYATMPVALVESELRRDKMPTPFIRRMRVINILSAVTLRKIEDNMIAPFDVMDIHHVLDKQISQDAIISILDNTTLAKAIETGNLQPLWAESKENPLLRKGFEQGWIQRFIKTPFDPICVMLAMRAKLMLDAIDELGHSYNLLRSLGMGWIDFGEIEGEEPGDPDSYIPPAVDTPIDYPDLPPDPAPDVPEPVPVPGEPGYVPPGDLVPGDPGYVPGPGDQGFVPPPGYEAVVPGHPDYVPGPGEPGYVYPPSPGGGFYGGDYGPGGSGTYGGPYGSEGRYSSLAAPLTLGFSPGSLLSRGWNWAGLWWGGLNCCLDYEDPELFVTIGYFTSSINAGDTLGLTVEQAHEDCGGENYEWIEVNGVGSLDAETGLAVIYTAPATGANCPGNAEIWLLCGGEVVATLEITINYDYAIEYDYATSAEEIVRETSEIVYVDANNGPFTWAISGTGFSLEHAETDGVGNVLHADETACGSATITITGCDDQQAVGYVRCTVGQWVQKSTDCQLSGVATSIVTTGTQVSATKIEGNKKQTGVYRRGSPAGSGLQDSCEAAEAVVCTEESTCLTFDLDCAVYGGGSYPNLCAPLVCAKDCVQFGDQYYIDIYNAKLQGTLIYSEWECAP